MELDFEAVCTAGIDRMIATSSTPVNDSSTLCFHEPRILAQPQATESSVSLDISNRKVLIIDDEPLMIRIIEKHLRDVGVCNIQGIDNAAHALMTIRDTLPDVVLLDVYMPNVSGLEILRGIQDDNRLQNISVIVLTASTDEDIKVRALDLGAADFLRKPVQPTELFARLKNTLMAKAYQDHLREYSKFLERVVVEKTVELETSRLEVIECLTRAAEFRDDDTGRHVLRVGRYARIIGAELGMDEGALYVLEQAAKLHDIGKIGIPDAILLKPGKLSSEEFEIMKEHCNYGERIIQRMSHSETLQLRKHTEMGASILQTTRSPILEVALKIVLTHHERWDGSGYPQGIAGLQIPLEGRITAVADVFDALSNKRPYKPAFSTEKSFSIMREQRGAQFDPRVLDAFFARRTEVIRTQIEFADH